MGAVNDCAPILTKVFAFAALASLSLGILWTLDAVTHVERYDEVRTIDPWSEQGAFTYAPILADGSGELAMGEPGYFTTDAPRVRIGFEWRLQDAGAERVTALASMKLVAKHAAQAGKPAWAYEEPIASATHAGAASDALAMSGEIDLPAIAARLEQTPGRRAQDATWSVVASVRFASAPNAAHAADASEFALPLTYAPPLYAFAQPAPIGKDHAQREVIAHEDRAGPEALVRAPAGPILLLAGLAVLARTLPALARDADDTEASA